MGCTTSKDALEMRNLDDSVHVGFKRDKKKSGNSAPKAYVPRAPHPILDQKQYEQQSAVDESTMKTATDEAEESTKITEAERFENVTKTEVIVEPACWDSGEANPHTDSGKLLM